MKSTSINGEMAVKEKLPWILYMSTYPPRECGIATFTWDLANSTSKNFSNEIKSKITAMNNNSTSLYNYPEEVVFQVNDTDIEDYIDIAKKINSTPSIKIINIQHEFGIFGGDCGDFLIPFLEIVNKPVIVTFHTVLPDPDERLKKIVQCISKKSQGITVMTPKAVEILKNEYDIQEKIFVIPHGIPNVPFRSSSIEKSKMGYKGKIILSSFGMMNSGKGYEYVIDALPDVIKEYPNILYLIIGETHPIVRKEKGESYRLLLEKKVKELGLQKHVKFYNKYLKLGEIIKYLEATDIYVSSNLNPDQIVSGTLSYAVGCGRAVISTPTLYAKDIVTPERGILVEFKNTDSYKSAILKLLSDPALRKKMEINNFSNTRHMTWPNVALSYMKVFDKFIGLRNYEKLLPKVKLRHMLNLTDKFGIIQFVESTKPDLASGYTLDDNARALIVSCMHYKFYKDETKLRLIKIYLDFIKYVQQNDGRLYNFVDYRRSAKLDAWSEDAQGRAMWALGYLISLDLLPIEFKKEAEEIFAKALKVADKVTSPRAIAYSITGLYFYNKVKPSENNKALIKKLAYVLVDLYNGCAVENWQWFETYLTYSNSSLPEALLYAYLATGNQEYLEIAKSSLEFLISITFENGMFIPIGQNGWYYQNGQKAYYDQQPIDTAAMVQTLLLAYDLTKEQRYREKALVAFHWFLGNNMLNHVVYDETTGGCHDGIGQSSINLNQGAESTISYLLARLSLEEFVQKKKNALQNKVSSKKSPLG